MKFSITVAALTSLLSVALANPLPQTTVTPGATTSWAITHYTSGCSPGGCTYNFNISGLAGPGFGDAFATFCSGSDVQNQNVACAETTLQANLVSTPGRGLVLYVERFITLGSETDLIAGNATTPEIASDEEVSFEIEARVYGAMAE